jgi:peptidoglycan hydrolase-like protein with peptidoglycan-binding domain
MMPTAFAADSLLKIGSSGDAVTALQNRLLTLGYIDYSVATGYFGAVTKTAVVRFQNYSGLYADGVVGPATSSVLYSSTAKSLVLNVGSRGEAVTTLQARLRDLGYTTPDNVTGYYGAITKSAATAFQSANGLYADGVAGPATRVKLFSDNAVRKTAAAPPATQAASIADIALTQVGKPYVLGGNGPSSYDCSGLAYYAMTNAGFSVSRLSASAYSGNTAWAKVTGTSSLQKGDLVFFHSDTSSYISHMGIYIGNGQFVHASSGQGKVMVSSFGSYWTGVYSFARRVA